MFNLYNVKNSVRFATIILCDSSSQVSVVALLKWLALAVIGGKFWEIVEALQFTKQVTRRESECEVLDCVVCACNIRSQLADRWRDLKLGC